MAFGGVATGNIKAVEQEIVAGIIRIIGLISIAKDSPAKTGNKVEAVAVFEVNSVVKTAIADTIIMSTTNGR